MQTRNSQLPLPELQVPGISRAFVDTKGDALGQAGMGWVASIETAKKQLKKRCFLKDLAPVARVVLRGEIPPLPGSEQSQIGPCSDHSVLSKISVFFSLLCPKSLLGFGPALPAASGGARTKPRRFKMMPQGKSHQSFSPSESTFPSPASSPLPGRKSSESVPRWVPSQGSKQHL